MPDSRPVFLDLTAIYLPVAGWMSIIHRLTGILLFVLIPLLIWMMQLVLSGEEGYARAQTLASGMFGKLALFLLLWALAHHFLAGIRYLLLDAQLGIQAPWYKRSAAAVIVAAPLVALPLALGLAP